MADTTDTIALLDPAAPAAGGAQARQKSLESLRGCTVGFIDNSKPNFNYLVEDLADLLVQDYGVRSVVKRAKRTASIGADTALLDELAGQCDLIIAGSGD
jgi:hypothetical protein